MQVEYRLTRLGSVVDHYSEVLPLVAKLFGNSFHSIDKFQMNFRWSRNKILEMSPMNHQQVNGRQRHAIIKHDHIIVFIENSRGRFSGEDLTKHARHRLIKADAPMTINQNLSCKITRRVFIPT